MMKADKCLYIKYYIERTPIHPGVVKAKLLKMGVENNYKPTPEEREKLEGEVKEYYLSCLMLYGSYNGRFVTIKNDLENKMTCG